MLTLVTGVNGSGKTNWLMGELLRLEAEGRVICVNHIHGLQVSSWRELEDEGVVGWRESVPKGAVLAVDEAHRLAPSRSKPPAPEWIARFDEHRHSGLDLYFVTQHPAKLDIELRRLCGRHVHFDRRFGMRTVSRWEWQRCVDDPTDRRARREGVRTSQRLDSSVYDKYESAEIHTHKRRVPWAVVGLVFFLLAALPFGWWLGSGVLWGRTAIQDVQDVGSGTGASALAALEGRLRGGGAGARESFVDGFGGLRRGAVVAGFVQYEGPGYDGERVHWYESGGMRFSHRDLEFFGWSWVFVRPCLHVARLPGGGSWVAACPESVEVVLPEYDPYGGAVSGDSGSFGGGE